MPYTAGVDAGQHVCSTAACMPLPESGARGASPQVTISSTQAQARAHQDETEAECKSNGSKCIEHQPDFAGVCGVNARLNATHCTRGVWPKVACTHASA